MANAERRVKTQEFKLDVVLRILCLKIEINMIFKLIHAMRIFSSSSCFEWQKSVLHVESVRAQAKRLKKLYCVYEVRGWDCEQISAV